MIQMNLVECVLVEENRTARKVGHVKSFMKNFVFDIFGSFLQGNDMPLSCNLFLDSIFLTSSGPRVPVVNAEPLLYRRLRGKVLVDTIRLRGG